MADPGKRNWLSRLRYLLLILCSCLFALALIEGLLRWLDIANPPIYEPDPNFGYLFRPNQWVSTRGYRFHINDAGLRGQNVVMPKPSGVYRIAFLGDSVTYGGGGVPDKDLFVNQVATSLSTQFGRPVEAINISAPGWSPQNLAGYVSAKGIFDADLVVWVIPSCDFRRHYATPKDGKEFTKRTELRFVRLILVGWDKLREHIHESSSPASSPDESRALQQNLQDNLKAFRTTVNQLQRKGLPIALVLVPYEWGYYPSAALPEYEAAATSCSVPFLDSAASLLSQKPKKLFIDGVHLNVDGHQVLAEAIAKFLGGRVLGGVPPGQLQDRTQRGSTQNPGS